MPRSPRLPNQILMAKNNPDLFDGPSSASKAYTAKDIEVLEGLEPVRRRPGMYIGGTDVNALHQIWPTPRHDLRAQDGPVFRPPPPAPLACSPGHGTSMVDQAWSGKP